jgi:hypothetical protein
MLDLKKSEPILLTGFAGRKGKDRTPLPAIESSQRASQQPPFLIGGVYLKKSLPAADRRTDFISF